MDEQALERVIDRTVTSTLTKVGFDLSDPIGMQEDMAFLRKMRGLTQAAGTKVVMVLVAVATVAIAGGTLVAIGRAIRNAGS